MGIHRSEAIKKAEEISKTITSRDTTDVIAAKSLDCMSFMLFDAAYMVKYHNYHLVFPEHHEFQVFEDTEYDVRLV